MSGKIIFDALGLIHTVAPQAYQSLCEELDVLLAQFEGLWQLPIDDHDTARSTLVQSDLANIHQRLQRHFNQASRFNSPIAPETPLLRNELRNFGARWNQFIARFYAIFKELANYPRLNEEELKVTLLKIQWQLVYPLSAFTSNQYAMLHILQPLLDQLHTHHHMLTVLVGSQFETRLALDFYGISDMEAQRRHNGCDVDIQLMSTTLDESFDAQAARIKAIFKDYRDPLKDCDEFYDPNSPEKNYLTVHIQIAGKPIDVVFKDPRSNAPLLTNMDSGLYLTGPWRGQIKSTNPYFLQAVLSKTFICYQIDLLYKKYPKHAKLDDRTFTRFALDMAYFFKLLAKKFRDNHQLCLARGQFEKLNFLLMNPQLVQRYLLIYHERHKNSELYQEQAENVLRSLTTTLRLPYSLVDLWQETILVDPNALERNHAYEKILTQIYIKLNKSLEQIAADLAKVVARIERKPTKRENQKLTSIRRLFDESASLKPVTAEPLALLAPDISNESLVSSVSSEDSANVIVAPEEIASPPDIENEIIALAPLPASISAQQLLVPAPLASPPQVAENSLPADLLLQFIGGSIYTLANFFGLVLIGNFIGIFDSPVAFISAPRAQRQEMLFSYIPPLVAAFAFSCWKAWTHFAAVPKALNDNRLEPAAAHQQATPLAIIEQQQRARPRRELLPTILALSLIWGVATVFGIALIEIILVLRKALLPTAWFGQPRELDMIFYMLMIGVTAKVLMPHLQEFHDEFKKRLPGKKQDSMIVTAWQLESHAAAVTEPTATATATSRHGKRRGGSKHHN